MLQTRTAVLALALGLLALGLPPSLTPARAARPPHARRTAYRQRHAAPPGAYAHDRVTSLADLKYQVKHYPFVRQRFARFFHKKPAEIPAFVEKNISVGRLPRTRSFTVYYVHGQRKMRKHRETLRAGAPVFVLTRTGQPVLNWDCGNPMDYNRLEFLTPSERTPHNKIAFVDVEQATSPSIIAVISPGELSSSLNSFVPGYTVSPLPFSSSSHLLPLVALGLIGLDHHHSSPPPAPVPEPSAFALLLVAMPLLGAALRRRASP